MGNMIESDAKAKADQVLSDARGEAARITGDAALQVEAEKRRLKESQEVSARFIESMNALCHRQLDFLEKVVRELREEQSAGAAAAEDSAEIHETVKSIEETIAKVAGEPVSDVRPDIAPRITEDEMPTKAFNIVSDPSDEVGTLNPFDLGE